MQGMKWTTRSDANFAAPSTTRMSLGWLVRTGLCVSFLTAFLQYEVSSGIAQYLSLAFLGLCGLLVLCGRQRNERVEHILSGGAVWFAAVLFGEMVSYTSRDSYSIVYGLVFLGGFLCARLVLEEIRVAKVIRAYSQAGILTAIVILISGRHSALTSESVRFSGGTRAHPNLIAFVLGGYFAAIVWRALGGNE